jgi:hypothetical protein
MFTYAKININPLKSIAALHKCSPFLYLQFHSIKQHAASLSETKLILKKTGKNHVKQ